VNALLSLLLAAPPAASLLVLPPELPAEAAEWAWAAEAVSDLLPNALLALGVPVVERADRLMALETLQIPPVALTRATTIRIAEAMGAPRVVIGRLEPRPDGLEVALRILDAERGTLSAPIAASGRAEALLELADGLAWDLALSGQSPPAGSRREFLARRAPPPLEALRSYGQGLSAPDTAGRVRALRRTLQLSPRFDDARLALGRLQMQARDYRAACETLASVREGPLVRPARFVLGQCFLETGRYRDAASVYAGLATGRASAAVLNNHALAILRGAGGDLRASDVLRKALELGPGDADIAFNLAFALLIEGDASGAAYWAQGVLDRNPADTHARVVVAWALRRAGRGEEADEAWREVLAAAPSYEGLATPDLGRRFERILPSERRWSAPPRGAGARRDGRV
jgi:thioredoxin-like negative regulator of GroEL